MSGLAFLCVVFSLSFSLSLLSSITQVWLFKPNLQLAYTTSKRYAIPKSGSMNAAKVLYKLIGPTEGQLNLKTYVVSVFTVYRHSL